MNDESLILINEQIAIPAHELHFRFSTSSGPGGQHANRSATRVTLFFDVANSPSLDDVSRALLLKKLANRLDKEGVLRISAQDSRSQHRNRETAVLRFQLILANTLKRPQRRRKTKPNRAANERRLTNKKKQGRRKQERRQSWH